MRRSTLVIVALALLAVLAFAASSTVGGNRTAHVSRYLLAQVGEALGMKASVLPNPTNTAARALKAKELALADRERILAEAEARLSDAARERSQTLLFVYAGGVLLLGLIAVNFALDARRKHAAASSGGEGISRTEIPFHV